MNLTIKRVLLSVVLLQTACAQAFTEFVSADELAERGQQAIEVIAPVVTEVPATIVEVAPVVEATAKGYMDGLKSVLSYRPSMPSMPSFSMPKVSMPSKDAVLAYVPSKETVLSYVPSKETVKSYIPSKDAVLAYVPSKETVMSYVPSKEAAMQYATAKNGVIAAGTVVTAAALYAGYKYGKKPSMPKFSMPKPSMPALLMPKFSMPKFSMPKGFSLTGKKAEDKTSTVTDLKTQVLTALNSRDKEAALSLVKGNAELTRLVNGYFVALTWKNDKANQRLNAIEVQLNQIK